MIWQKKSKCLNTTKIATKKNMKIIQNHVNIKKNYGDEKP